VSGDFKSRSEAALDATLESSGDIGDALAEVQREFEARIAAALSRLPVIEDRRGMIEDEAGYLFDICAGSEVLDVPSEQKGGAVAAARKLAALRTDLLRVSQAIRALPLKARRALNAVVWADAARAGELTLPGNPAPHHISFGIDAVALAQAAEIARQSLLAEPDADAGRPKKVAAARVTDELFGVYERLTGRAPAVTTDTETGVSHGPLVAFVSEIFDMFGIDAGAASQISLARARAKKKVSGGQ
jgi:hypothetical protein